MTARSTRAARALLLALLAAGCSSRASAPVAGGSLVGVAARRTPAAPRTVAEALRAAHVPFADGALLSARTHRVLDAHYHPTRVLRNGKLARPSDPIGPGDRLEVRQGVSVVEGTRQVVVNIPRPDGPAVEYDLLTDGHSGVAIRTVGVHSGEIVRRKWVRALARPARARRPLVALTFDDGPDPTWTPKVLAILAHEHVRATFCLIGRQARRYPDLVRAIKAGGHLLCNHTEHHAQHLDTAPRQVVQAELAAAQASIRVGAGRVPRLFRAPYGAISDVVLAEARAQHMRVLLWDVDPSDWTRPSTGTVISRVLHGVRPGSVVLLHDGGGDRAPTVGALPAIIHGLRAAHYRFALP